MARPGSNPAEFAAQVLQPLFSRIWEEKQLPVPDNRTKGVIMMIVK